jgi:hypothetical protein
MLRLTFQSTVCAMMLASAHAAPLPVDMELVIAVDVSASMDREKFFLQRAGYAEAIRHPEFVRTVLSGVTGRIALAYVEWSGTRTQKIVVPWRLIDSAQSAAAFSEALEAQEFAVYQGTSISTGLLFSATLFNVSGYEAPRKVIDVSGDGPNNYGPPVTLARDFIVARGIVINGLPIMIDPSPTFPDMDRYYEACVTGGKGSFVEPVYSVAEFGPAIRRKLVEEARVARMSDAPVILAAGSEPVDCLVGEKARQQYSDQYLPGLDN